MISIHEHNESPPIESHKTQFISKHDLIWVIMLALVGMLMNRIPYKPTLSLLLQFGLGTVLFIFNIKRPVFIIIGFIFLNILPNRLVAGFGEGMATYYTLSKNVNMILAVLFLLTSFIILKNKYKGKFNFWLIGFVVFALLSYSWAITKQYYNYDFWWICVAYCLFPYFIESERDVKLILFSYFIYIQILSVFIFPILAKGNLIRGTVRLDANYASFSILLGVVSALTLLILYNDQLNRFLKVSLFAGMVFSVVLMSYFASRTAFICLALMLIILSFIKIIKIKTIVFTIIIISSAYLILNNMGYFNSVLGRFSDKSADNAGGRIIIWQDLMASFGKQNSFRCLFGNGHLTEGLFGIGMQAHNTYLSILIGFGIIGLFLFIGYQINTFISIISRKFMSYLLLAVCLLIYNFSLEPYIIYEGVIFFSLLGAIGNITSNA